MTAERFRDMDQTADASLLVDVGKPIQSQAFHPDSQALAPLK